MSNFPLGESAWQVVTAGSTWPTGPNECACRVLTLLTLQNSLERASHPLILKAKWPIPFNGPSLLGLFSVASSFSGWACLGLFSLSIMLKCHDIDKLAAPLIQPPFPPECVCERRHRSRHRLSNADDDAPTQLTTLRRRRGNADSDAAAPTRRRQRLRHAKTSPNPFR
ncbi:hypothetical protein AXF42_Ash020604 [Apostasia shenzhenica]|uniref:Uncharacterized protein n=1 Tax=Apostasia shenzhenica TaxID=1088818 RepID=A0A2I0A0F0_9ASPA|nr:hypothetical protein AXF42_Ash020604 [Apostasia shenzhenica]